MNLDATMNPGNRAMNSVFITNIQPDVVEEQLKSFFAEVGPIINFQLVKLPKSQVAFCEYKDPVTALRACRNLTGLEYKGKSLQVDLANSEKCRQELEKLQGTIDTPSEPVEATTDKAPEEISKAVASLPPEQMFELMKQMKMCIENNPQEARNLLLQNPQLAYALLQAQVIMRIVDPEVAVKILNRPPAVAASLSAEVKDDAVPQADPTLSESSPAFLPGMAAVASDTMAATLPAPVSVPPPSAIPSVRPVVPPMMTAVGPTAPLIPNQFADQDLRLVADQDLRRLPNLGDMRVPSALLGVDKDMRQPMGDQDLRTLGLPMPAVEARPFDPRFRNMPGPERGAIPGLDRARPTVDPRTPYDPRAGAPRVEDPRKASMSAAALNSRLAAAGPALQNLGPNLGGPPGAMGPVGMIPDEQEKAALILQVLQLTDQQIAVLSPEQRQSIMVLKEQLARSQLT